MKKHIDNHLNPHSAKGRRNANNNNNNGINAVLNATNLTNTIAAVASGVAADTLASKAASTFLGMDNKNNIIPRMVHPVVKNELYFPQCYGPSFNQPFPGTTVSAHVQGQSNGSDSSGHVNNNNSGESSPTGMVAGPPDGSAVVAPVAQ